MNVRVFLGPGEDLGFKLSWSTIPRTGEVLTLYEKDTLGRSYRVTNVEYLISTRNEIPTNDDVFAVQIFVEPGAMIGSSFVRCEANKSFNYPICFIEKTEMASVVENYLNKEINKNPDKEQTFSFNSIASSLGYEPNDVESLLKRNRIHIGNRGFTVIKNN